VNSRVRLPETLAAKLVLIAPIARLKPIGGRKAPGLIAVTGFAITARLAALVLAIAEVAVEAAVSQLLSPK